MTTVGPRARRTSTNTIAKAKVTFAMIELGDPADCNDRKRVWQRYGYRDITPLFAGRPRVISLNGEQALESAPQLLQMMSRVNADWYLLSGHHGRVFCASQRGCYRDPDGVEYHNAFDYSNKLKWSGFFNNDYHHGRWATATTAADQDRASTHPKYADHFAHELYLTTSEPWPPAKFPQDNPLQQTSMNAARQAKCKGIILSACNTLSFKSVRTCWNSYYPGAVFFGVFRTIAAGKQITDAIHRAAMTTDKFWRNPPSVLTSADKVKDLAYQIAANFPRSRRHFGLGVMYKQMVYVPQYDSKTGLRILVCAHDVDLPYPKND